MKGAMFLAAAAAALVLASPAGAATYPVAGKQRVIDADAGTYKMTGGLLGNWKTTSFEEVALSPYYEGKGTESFTGCIDRRRDRSCNGDPSGTLTFEFRYWAIYGSADPASLVWGACWHPVVSGTGAFAGAQGVLTFVDSPTTSGVTTRYIGSLTLQGGSSSRKAQARVTRAPHC
ncbi:MAG: hypothetical protein ACXVII_28250 [Solirubrobacteraceae bacterium]